MVRRLSLACGLLSAGLVVACGDGDPGQETWSFDLPARIPAPKVPVDNPMTTAKVELGRHLFYAKELSANQSQACASCHEQARAFAEGRDRAVGSTGQVHPRNAQGLANVAYASSLTWANPLLVTLEQQAAVPLFGEFPVELGVVGNEAAILDRFRTEVWQDRFRRAFPDEADPVRFDRIAAALASFERTLLSFDSPYDRYLEGDAAALSPAAQRGLELFFSDELECFHCHGGFLFSEAVNHEGLVLPEGGFFNTGLYNLDGAGAYPLDNPGLIEITGVPEDMGRFRAPSLRNVAVTAPYLDDGTAETLEEVIDIYARGGRRIDAGPRAGDGSRSPLKSGFVSGFRLTPEERADLVAFLESLTDPTFLTDPRFSDPKGPSR